MEANTVSQINFHLKNQRPYQQEAIALATQYAIEDAKALAQASQVKLLRILSIQLNPTFPSPQPRIASYSFKAEMNDAATAIVPGEIDILANVTLIYEIQ